MKKSQAQEKICPLLSSRNPDYPWTMCQGDDCMMWVTTFRPKGEAQQDLELTGYCAFRKTMYSVDE